MRSPLVSAAASDKLLTWVSAQSSTWYVAARVGSVSPAWADTGTPLSHSSIEAVGGMSMRSGMASPRHSQVSLRAQQSC